MLLKIIMDKEKVIKSLMWFSALTISIILAALSLYIGFNNQRHGDNTILIIAAILIIVVFYCAFRGIKIALDAIFKQ